MSRRGIHTAYYTSNTLSGAQIVAHRQAARIHTAAGEEIAYYLGSTRKEIRAGASGFRLDIEAAITVGLLLSELMFFVLENPEMTARGLTISENPEQLYEVSVDGQVFTGEFIGCALAKALLWIWLQWPASGRLT